MNVSEGLLTLANSEHTGVNVGGATLKGSEGICDGAAGVVVEMCFCVVSVERRAV